MQKQTDQLGCLYVIFVEQSALKITYIKCLLNINTRRSKTYAAILQYIHTQMTDGIKHTHTNTITEIQWNIRIHNIYYIRYYKQYL